YRHYADDVVEKFIKSAVKNGVDVFRIFDALNDIRNLETAIKAVKKNNKHAQGTIAYTTSPVHNIENFVKLATQMASLGCDSIAIKDMAGLLTPAITRQLIPALKKSVNLPLHLHSHAASGLSMLCQWEAIQLGCEHVDTAISSFADGPSHVSTEALVAALKNTQYDSGLNLELLQEIAEYFSVVRKKYHRFENENNYVDTRVQIYQVPGGMISNLYQQLREQNALDKLKDVFAEIPRVRKDLGYPPLVTPTSQIVGTQAVLNVLSKERYKTITNEVKRYLLGMYGRAPGEVDKSIRQKAIGNTEHVDCRPADLLKPELTTLKSEIEKLIHSEEDILSYALFPEVTKNYFIERENNHCQPEPLELEQKNSATLGLDRCAMLPKNFTIYLHGETYEINVRGSGQQSLSERNLYLTVDGLPEEILIQQEVTEDLSISSENEKNNQSSGARLSKLKTAAKPGDVTAAMPGLIVEIKTSLNSYVSSGDVLLVIEAMKMETEIQAPISGAVTAININKGDSVIPNQVLIEIDPTQNL
ncbi:MAG: pyruvate carboxylase subunit B, partial [Gammaproteobacteria bacterium]|nr:pyruvate carboxylase subunit B [Gammaproteobacteria bacterium]